MSLAPRLQKIRVDVAKLLLDPNNPRLFTAEEAKVPMSDVGDPGVQAVTKERLFPPNGKDQFRIEELKRSILKNRYVPEAGGYIFVRSVPDTGFYLVLEGNRRLVAMRQLLADADSLGERADAVLSSIRTIEVLNIIDDLPEQEIQRKVSYLLGTCHHGSHRKWSPFARAKGIHDRYLEISGCDAVSFKYQKPFGEAVASLLSITEKEVSERLAVYCAMRQLADDDRLKAQPKGGVIDSHYSLVLGAVRPSNAKLKEYISTNPDTFRLEGDAVDRMLKLCNFDGTRDRNSPREPGQAAQPPAMVNPKQWGHLAKILSDDNQSARDSNLALVEEHGQPPEEVWAQRFAELTKLTWKKWLEQVVGVLEPVNISDDLETPEATQSIQRLNEVLTRLSGPEGAR
jgi:hypothetical protein